VKSRRDYLVRYCLLVVDLDRELKLFTEKLGFTLISILDFEAEELELLYGVPGLKIRRAILTIGRQELALIMYLKAPGGPYPHSPRSNDLWFQHLAIVVRDMDEAYERIRDADIIPVSSRGPQTIPDWNEVAGGVKAFYFRDAEQHPLELIWFPPNKGHPVWKEPKEELFLGIDHSALVVLDTARSLHFYRDLLGMKVIGECLNYGETQEWLCSVPGARVKITGLRHEGDFSPGIEFLEYIEPPCAQRIPPSRRNNDVAYGHAMIYCRELPSVMERLTATGVTIVSDGIVAGNGKIEFDRLCMVRDPDGHDVLLVGDE